MAVQIKPVDQDPTCSSDLFWKVPHEMVGIIESRWYFPLYPTIYKICKCMWLNPPFTTMVKSFPMIKYISLPHWVRGLHRMAWMQLRSSEVSSKLKCFFLSILKLRIWDTMRWILPWQDGKYHSWVLTQVMFSPVAIHRNLNHFPWWLILCSKVQILY